MTYSTARQQPNEAPRRQPLAGEVAIVTGASSGIGAATAQELARRGARVVLAARRADALEAQVRAIKEAGGEALAVSTDVADQAQLARLVEQANERFGRVDILVNNAGIDTDSLLAEMRESDILQMVQVNLLSAMLLTRAVLPGMLARRHGAIITVTSIAGNMAFAPLYSGTKYGLRGFMLSLRRELLGSGVSASIVAPGYISTPMNGNLGGVAGPEVIARTIAGLVEHPRRELIRPRFYRLPYAYHLAIWLEQVAPWLMDIPMRRRIRRRFHLPA
jgi:NAD(P)-dependent dehydrogenase (short-subunit alcohol dehydrogenase family)